MCCKACDSGSPIITRSTHGTLIDLVAAGESVLSKTKHNSHRIDADFTEEVVGMALDSFLATMCFPRQRFSIEPFSRSAERWLGADAVLTSEIQGFRPFYMQFKRPSAYPDFSVSKIVTDRAKLGLQTGPRSLYFPLREKQKSHSDYQHNVLFNLRQELLKTGDGDAAYVCPLFVDRATYRYNLHWAGVRRWPLLWRHVPWDLDDVVLHGGSGKLRFDRVPLFAAHISVPPHATVTSARHRYSFTESGTELCFHSPEALPDGAESFGKFLTRIAEGFLDRGRKISPEDSIGTLSNLIDAVYSSREWDGPSFVSRDSDPMGRWFAWGEHLRSEYAIEQFALVAWRD